MNRVNKATPCPICESTSWCGYSLEKPVVVCMRVESVRKCKNGGWIHYLGEERTKWEPRRYTPKPKPRPVAPDMFELQGQYQAALTPKHLVDLAVLLGVTEESLRRLQVGWDGKNWSFPMCDANEKIIGIKLRATSGSKFCVDGSQLGIYWPVGVEDGSKEPLLICEGESDTAALLSMGFQAIGRPSCTGGVEIIKAFVSRRWRDVIIVADKDTPKTRQDGSQWMPGIEGAKTLVDAIKPLVRNVRVIKPGKHKDARQFLQNGGTKAAMELLIKAAKAL